MIVISGCYQLKTVVRVNSDGSGTISETMLFSKKRIAEMEASAVTGNSPPKQHSFDINNPDKLKEQARAFGKGVRFRSSEKILNDDYLGVTAIYEFDDFAKLTLYQKSAPAMTQSNQNGSKPLPITFQFHKGSPAILTVVQTPETAPNAAQNNSTLSKSASEADYKMITEMLKGVKMEIGIEVNGTIVETNASQRNGNYFTLMALDFDKAIESKLLQLNLGSLVNSPSMSNSTLKDIHIPGVVIETNEKMTVVFE